MHKSYLFILSPFLGTDFKQEAILFTADVIPGKSSEGDRDTTDRNQEGTFLHPLHRPLSDTVGGASGIL